MAARKIPRVDSSAPQATSRLLRHWHMLRTPLLPYLTTPDCVALLWTHHSFQDDEVGRRVFVAVEEYAPCLLLGCPSDWCAQAPTFHWEPRDRSRFPSAHRCYYFHGQTGIKKVVHRPTSVVEMVRVWQAKLGSIERCASLLSLASLMATKLEPLLYWEEAPGVMSQTIVPFILPLSRLKEIAQSHPPPGPATPLGCHLQNITGEVGEEVHCEFCKACASVHRDIDDEAREYSDHQQASAEAFEQRIRDEGYDSDSSEFHARIDEFQAQLDLVDEFYDVDEFHDNLGLFVAGRCKVGKLAPLQIIEETTSEDLIYAANRDFYGPTNSCAYCTDQLRPLVAFFRRNGFGPMHRKVLARDEFDAVGGEYDKDRICRVEMVGAAAPHGFFAGVYYVERPT